MRFSNEIRVGAVVLLGFCVIIYGYFYLRNLGLGADNYYVRVAGAATIAQGNDVRLQGVKIGQIQEVAFDSVTQQPLLTLAVRRSNPPFKLLKTYKYSIQTAGIIGDSYLDIRGEYNPLVPAYLPNDNSTRIVVIASGGLQNVTESAGQIVQDFRKTLTKVNTTLDKINNRVLGDDNQVKLARALEGVAKLTNNASQSFGPNGVRIGFGDTKAQANLNETLKNAADASRYAQLSAKNIAAASGDARNLVLTLRTETTGMLSENRSRISSLLDSMDKAANNVAGVTETLDFALKQGGFKENAQITFQSLRRAAENVEVATTGLRRLGEDKATQDDLRTTLHALRESSEALRDTTASIKTIVTDPANTGQLKSAMSTLGETSKNLLEVTNGLKNMVGDPKLQADVKGAAENLNGTLAATRSAAERVNGLLGGRRNRKAPAAGVATDAEPRAQHTGFAPGGFDFTYRHLFERSGAAPGGEDATGHNYGDLDFNSEFFGGPFRLGLANIGAHTSVTAQTGGFLGQNAALRYGIYRSKLGAGLELHEGRFSLEGNLYDPNSRSYNLYGGFQVTPNLEVMAGRENVRGSRANALALKITP